jgi:kumamolisin
MPEVYTRIWYKVCGNSNCSGSPIPHIGWVNPVLYQLFANAQTYSPYHDVTTGTNDDDYAGTDFAGDFPAATCYDMTTGVGSPDAWNLARDIATGVQTSGGGPCAAPPLPTTQQLINDGGFENSSSGWQRFSAGGFDPISTVDPHDGANSFFACAYPGCDDRVWQTITVPATVKSATLSFWVNGASSLAYWVTANPSCIDHFYVTFAKPDGTVIDTVQSTCSLIALGYTIESFNVTAALQALVGQQVVVMFRGTATNEAGAPGAYSYWFVDDVSLTATTS